MDIENWVSAGKGHPIPDKEVLVLLNYLGSSRFAIGYFSSLLATWVVYGYIIDKNCFVASWHSLPEI